MVDDEEDDDDDRGALVRFVVDLGVVFVVVVVARMVFLLASVDEELEDEVDEDVRLLEADSLLRVICLFFV